jgi:ABC-type transporter Mla MlaB component
MNELKLSGELTFNSVASVLQNVIKGIDECHEKNIHVDLANIKNADSSALALMLEGKRYAARKGLELSYTGVPSEIERLATFCLVKNLLF